MTGVAADSARDTASAPAGAAARPPAGSCLDRAGPTKSLQGVRDKYHNQSLPANTKVDASDAQIVSSAPKILVFIGGGEGICWHGGEIIGQFPPSTPWATMHDSYGLDAHVANFTLESLRVFDTGDGATMDEQGTVNWTWRDVYFKYIRDDCVENDFLNSGTIEGSFFDGCYSGFSARSYTRVRDGSDNLVVVRNSLFRMQAMDKGYGRSGVHGGFWKWGKNSPRISLYNVVFLTDAPTAENDVILPPPDKLQDCVGNVMIWLGAGPFPERLPERRGCFRLLTGDAGRRFWDSAVARWKAAHPALSADRAPPIVSLWSPLSSATLAGTVRLTATAVDDREVAGVRFDLDGQAVGPELTTESPPTKFTLAWDSRGKPNGTYRLTATARDAAGHATISAGVTVTVSN